MQVQNGVFACHFAAWVTLASDSTLDLRPAPSLIAGVSDRVSRCQNMKMFRVNIPSRVEE
jgi:hypothetical protein